MESAAIPNIIGGRKVAVAVQVQANCTTSEILKIQRLASSKINLAESVAYVDREHLPQTENYLPEKTKRVELLPVSEPLASEYTPLGDSFIFMGGLLEHDVLRVFEQVVSVNSRRFADLEFHFPLDALASFKFGPNKFLMALDNGNPYMRILDDLHVNRKLGYLALLDGDPQDPVRQGSHNIILQWHLSMEGLLACFMAKRSMN